MLNRVSHEEVPHLAALPYLWYHFTWNQANTCVTAHLTVSYVC